MFDALALAMERSRSLAEDMETKRISRRWVLAAAASFVGLLAGGLAVSLQNTAESLDDGGLFAEDYLRRAVAEERIESSDAGEVSRFLTRELGRPIQLLQLAGLQVTSAEICLIEGRRGAMIQYVQDGREIYHYLIPRDGTQPRDPEPASAWSSDTSGGPALITWATPQIEQALVGEVPVEHLIELARNASL